MKMSYLKDILSCIFMLMGCIVILSGGLLLGFMLAIIYLAATPLVLILALYKLFRR